MKPLIYTFLLAIAISAGSCTSARYVHTRPTEVIVTRPVRPGPGYVWIDGDYYWRGGGYQYRNGYWALPRRGRGWHGGTWMQNRRGYYWHPGRWR